MPSFAPLAEYLAERDAEEAEDVLLAAGIERTPDLLQLTVEDLASLGISPELQWRLTGSAPCVDVEEDAASDMHVNEPPKIKKRPGPAASQELDGFLEKNGLGEATALLVELGIERFGDLQALSAEDVGVLGLPIHLQSGLLLALGYDRMPPEPPTQTEVAAPAPVPSRPLPASPQEPPPAPHPPPEPPLRPVAHIAAASTAPLPVALPVESAPPAEASTPAPFQIQPPKPPGAPPGVPMLGQTRARAATTPAGGSTDGEEEGIGAFFSNSARFIGGLFDNLSSRTLAVVSAPTDVTSGPQLVSAELGGPVEDIPRGRRATLPLGRDMSRPALLMSESSNDIDELLAKNGSGKQLSDLLAQRSFITE